MDNNIIIKVEGVGKKYLLNKNAATKSDTLYGNVLNSLKNLKDITRKQQTEDFWALHDVSFEIKKGDRVGIIGRNGAGKSTLLKILSRITPPTKGRIEITGKVASLLEVGTGFHGDLSGRENIYLNGSILGMSKYEIDRKFDEIVAFAEVEKFLDTPVKRYSSGMYVRLAFAVAAHLEPEILIVDEVLAVGDIAFQKKCLGKMEDVSTKEGRTILFVSHNMGQISSLCKTGILLNKGRVEMQGNIQEVISEYFNYSGNDDITEFTYDDSSEKEFFIKKITLLNSRNEECKNFAHNESINLSIEVKKNKHLSDVILGVHFYDIYDKRIFTTQIAISDITFDGNCKKFHLQIPDSFLTPNTYYFSVGVHIPNIQVIDEKEKVGNLTIYDNGSDFFKYPIGEYGVVFANSKWIY
jgi:lipopolysaccharide transport system ATP-binding protein